MQAQAIMLNFMITMSLCFNINVFEQIVYSEYANGKIQIKLNDREPISETIRSNPRIIALKGMRQGIYFVKLIGTSGEWISRPIVEQY